MLPSKSTKGCWTCKDRKIACDKHLPTCQNCRHSGRECLGYGMRLSWPRKNDQKRAITSEVPDQPQELSSFWFLGADFVNVFSSDVELSDNTLNSVSMPRRASPRPRIFRNPSWMPFTLNSSEIDLFSYYMNNVSHKLTAANNAQIQNLVVRMSFADVSPASSAILYIIYAIANLHLSNISQALEYKSKAVNAVWASSRQSSALKDVRQRIIAVNFLALFDAFATPSTPREWASSICYSKTASIIAFPSEQAYQGDLAVILDWVYYYDVLSKFAVRHFDRRTPGMIDCAKRKDLMVAEMNSQNKTNIVPTLACSIEVLSTIACIIDVVLEMETNKNSHTETLDKLDRRLKFAKQYVRIEDLDASMCIDRKRQIEDIAELYRLAGLIYLNRAGRNVPTSSPVLQRLTEKAFVILETLHTCERTFPLFLVGCEARTDDQRTIVLRVIDRTQSRFPPASIMRIRGYIERFWAQNDLDTGQAIDYALKMTTAMSNADGLPAFA
ncbi:hypothetical protein K505DRAFT_307580 [Melanomma pulvis-pyrius CBS 109.77]|uniref:Zn(2)-C6 fungal-type domain-containing protein n=1 Tax=Melanomma pulvis-pyrius CBS 109.77 TaxID=1314802 RepID=A0A6A6X835_9PLEO|nr:hypothetical protein K505DRAFT_307580 [Melanomma pulvis-pyrius CBS 109.77]